MYTTAQIIQLAIVALLGGMAIPLLVQVFLTARTVQRVSMSLERKVDDTRKELHELLAPPRQRESGASELSALLASAAVPAVIAAVRAFRASAAAPPEIKPPSNGHLKEKTP